VTSVVVLLGFSLGTWFGAARAEREHQQHLTQIKKIKKKINLSRFVVHRRWLNTASVDIELKLISW